MKAFIRAGGVALVAAALVLATAGVAAAKPKKQSAAKYAKTVCATYSQLITDVGNFDTAIGNLDPSLPADFQTQATSLTITLQATVKADEAKLTGAYPDVSNGKKIAKLLVTNATEIDLALTDALSKFQTNPGVAAPTLFKAAIQILSTKLSDPFSKVKDQSLITAFQKEKSCKSVVQVTGG